ncbi:Myc-type, basic helix-loop-helix domain-containing protein [Tanacetum coccineum]
MALSFYTNWSNYDLSVTSFFWPLEMKILKQDASNKERSLSAQSLAARARRRKISEKTQEFRKLIPGGQKMNTTKIFQAAFKYVTFLHASHK